MATKKPTKKSDSEKPKAGLEIGASGTNIFSGIVNEEYLSELSGIRMFSVYDRMRKSDATVKAALSAVQLPIRRAQWFVTAASEDARDMEISQFVSRCLFEEMSITWDDFIRQALLCTTFGVMVFEKVFEVREIDGKMMVVWKKFGPRMPKTITKWQQADGTDGIQQSLPQGYSVSIPMEKLLIFVNEKEGDNWLGNSALRAAYKHWFMKAQLETIDAVGHERQGLGIPFVKLESNATAAETTQAEKILKNMRAHEEGYLIEPHNMSVEFKDMKATGVKDAARAIDYHNREITMAVLAQFLTLGSGPSGSRALSEDQSELFLQSIEAVANNIKDVINKYAIKQLVELNFGKVEKLPKLDYSGIARTDVNALTTSYQRLVQTGGMKPSEADETFFRKVMGLPERIETDEDEEEDDAEEPKTEEVAEDLGLPEDVEKASEADIRKALHVRMSDLNTGVKRIVFMEARLKKVRKLSAASKGFAEVEKVMTAEVASLKKMLFEEKDNFKSWRKLTFAEKKVNFSGLQAFMDKGEATLIDEANVVLAEATEEYLRRLTNYVNDNDLKAVNELEMPYWNQYKRVIKDSLKESFAYGKNNAAVEMGVNAPANPQDIGQVLDLMAENIATQHYYEIETQAKQALGDGLSKFGEREIRALASAAVSIAANSQKLLRDTAAIVVASSINKGRSLVFEKNASKIYALQRSEILDEATCNFCLSIDGRIVEKDDPLAREGTFHSNCRGIWVEIMNDEEELPRISGIPDSIRDRIGDAVNEIVQPKKPIVRKDSLAAQAIAKGKAGVQDEDEE